MAAPRVSVVIPSYNARDTLGACLRSVLSQALDEPFEVVVADSSDDDTRAILEREPGVRLVTFARRAFAAAARNAGVRASSGELVVFIDADCVAPPGWLQQLVAAARTSSDVVGGSVAPRPPHSAVGVVMHALSFSHFLPSRNAPAEVAFVPTCNLAIARSLFLSLGGFPEQYERGEDMAFGHLARAAGTHVVFVPSAAVEHVERTSLVAAAKHQWASGYWSGRVRETLPMRGSFLAASPIASALLVPYRFVAVGLRLCTARGYRLMAAAWFALWPLSLGLLTLYAVGFARGARKQR